jgi:squalene-hopene/tetraprenyl-beta-curcumene cyclase
MTFVIEFKKMNLYFFFSLLLVIGGINLKAQPLSTYQLNKMSVEASKIQDLEVASLLAEQKPQGYWFYPSYMGTAFTSQYWLVAHWLGFNIPDFDIQKFQKIVLAEQLSDGSWYYLPDEGISKNGPVGVCILNYWALKSMGLPVDHPQMMRAREFILKHGGLEASGSFARVLLMAFGNLKWGSLPSIPNLPLLSLKDYVGFVNSKFASWMRAFIPPIAYLAQLRVSKYLGEQYDLAELAKNKSSLPKHRNRQHNFSTNYKGEKATAKLILDSQRLVANSWGGSTPATLFSMMVLDHAQNYMPEKKKAMNEAIQKGLSYVHFLTLNSENSAYRGVIFDGRYWDSVLIGGVLLEAGVAKSDLFLTANYIDQRINRRTGGLSFGLDFEPEMDTDDTAEMLIFFNRGSFFYNSIYKGVEWLNQMQNDESSGAGGWGAFSKNNNPVFYLKQLTDKFKDTAEVYDPSTPDVTGHILEALGQLGFSLTNDPSSVIQNAVEYIRRSQKPDGTWFGRWGVNSIYGTALSIVGLREIGIPADDPMIQKGIAWIVHCQKINSDGGFGESFLSYSEASLDCLDAPSSPTQTGWALLALLKVRSPTDPIVLRAVEYLLNTYQYGAGWKDKVINGTGHPVVTPMFYPSYAKIFPLQAIVRWLKTIKEKN